MSDEIVIECDQELVDSLVSTYVRGHLLPCSIERYNAALDSGKGIQEALYDAIFNEQVNTIVRAESERVIGEKGTSGEGNLGPDHRRADGVVTANLRSPNVVGPA